MKNILPVLLLAGLLAGCSKNHGYEDTGTVIGHDYRKCMYCGGWFIRIDEDTLRFLQVPEGCTIDFEDPAYPFEVYLDWHPQDTQPMGDEIIVERMELKK